nr:FadR family transcriptional regulator [Acidobacteriota bacterium]
MKAHTYRHATVVDALGLAITSEELQSGTVLRAEELVAEFGVS